MVSGQGYDVAAHVLACFGGAGGQHACAIAAALGMRTIFVHRYSGILSAVGERLALLASCYFLQWSCGFSLSHSSNCCSSRQTMLVCAEQ